MAYRHLAWFRREAQHVLDQVLVNYQGNELLLLGHDTLLPVAASPMKHCFSMVSSGKPEVACLVEPENLPLPNEVLDIAILWHSLDQHDRPVLLLKELKRVLRPDGLLIVMGVNPWRSTARYVSSKQSGDQHDKAGSNTLTQIQIAANEIGFSVDKLAAFAGVAKLGGSLQASFNNWICRYTPRLALGYCLVLKPQEMMPLTPVGAKWKQAKLAVGKIPSCAQYHKNDHKRKPM